MLHSVLMIVHFFCAAAIVALVLLQRGRGADAGAGFGAGASGTVFGARGATTALSRATAILAALFMVTSLSLTYLSSHRSAAPGSLLDELSQRPANAPGATAPGTTASQGAAAPGGAAPGGVTAPGAVTAPAGGNAPAGGTPPAKN
jgi:preprotein translocase subunit SecG